jgi:hypothetical protein
VADRRRWVRLAIVAVVAVGSGSEAACGDGGGRPLGWQQPRDEEIRSTIDAVWEAIGADGDQFHLAEYAYTFGPDNRSCADLDRDDRWFGERGSSGNLAGRGQAEIEQAIVEYLDGEGFDVQLYHSTHPDSPLRAYLAVRDEMTVDGILDGEGGTSVNVRSGPCARFVGRFDPERYEPDD